jgi:hypothetical protein
MRKQFLAMACAGLIAVAGAVPAFAADSTVVSTLYTCTASASLTKNGTTLASSTSSFKAAQDLSGSYSKSYTSGGATYVASASVSCKR